MPCSRARAGFTEDRRERPLFSQVEGAIRTGRTNGVYRQDFLEECVEAFGAERLLFASMCPVFDQGFERARSIRTEENDRPLVLGENALRLLGAETSS